MKVTIRDFVDYVGDNSDRWDQLTGRKVKHSTFGEGIVEQVELNDGGYAIRIAFQKRNQPAVVRCFGKQVLYSLEPIDFPDALAQKIIAGTSRQSTSSHKKRTARQGEERSKGGVIVPEAKFSLNADVHLKKDLTQRGRIIRVLVFDDIEWNYEVFFSGRDTRVIRESELELWQPKEEIGTLSDLLCDLALVKLRRNLRDTLYALYASRTKFEVYQFKPALKFLANPEQRLLIADEVGLGKTIEAGIIYLELQARLDLDHVLIVCPSSLRQKWQDEMKARFDEEFNILDTQGVKRFLEQFRTYGSGVRLRGIISLELIRRRELAEAFADIKLDLVIIDEAHHCRNTNTLANAVASVLAENADAALLLTATPLQMGQADLFNLLNILSPGEFDNVEAFVDRLEPNHYVNRAAQILATGDSKTALTELRKVEGTSQRQRFLGNPYYQEVLQILNQSHPVQHQLVTAQRRLLELNTLASVFTRTRKRDISEKTPLRTAITLPVNFTVEEKRYYEQVIEDVREEFYQRHWSGQGSGFVTVMKERQVASCISAYFRRQNQEEQVVYPEDEAYRGEFMSDQELSDEEADEGEFSPYLDGSPILTTRRRTSAVSTRFKRDSKFEVFWKALKGVLDEDPKTKVLVFSFFRNTIDYLRQELSRLGVNVRSIHGGYNVMDRYKIIEEFRDNPEIRVLISSDVGSEGLDFQFCDTLFNYDLPWNPMKVEQRIGRIDRFGQESEKVRIFNLVIEDSIESRILYRLYERIEIFKRSIGDIEAILGEQIRELAKSIWSKQLNKQEQMEQADLAARNILRKKQEMEEFEKNKLQFLGQEAIFSTAVEQTIESGRYVSEVEIKALVETYIRQRFPYTRLESNGADDSTYTLFSNEDLVEEIRTFTYEKRKNDAVASRFLQRLRAGAEIPLTFNSNLAYQRKLLEFVTPRHPLADAALEYWEKNAVGKDRKTRIRIHTDAAPAGDYCFFIFSFTADGLDKDARIVPVVVWTENGDVHTVFSKQFLRLVQTSTVVTPVTKITINPDVWREAEYNAYLHMTNQRDTMQSERSEFNAAMVNARLSAVEQSYEAKKRSVEARREKVTDRRIIRMYESQLRNMKAKFEAKSREIQSKSEVHVSFSLELSGVVEVENLLEPSLN